MDPIDDPVSEDYYNARPDHHHTQLYDIFLALDPMVPAHTILKLQSGIVQVCDSCQTSDPELVYYTLPCGHTLHQECLETVLRPQGIDHDGHPLPRKCPQCQHSWGPRFAYAERAENDELADWNNVTFAAKVRNGLDHLCQARATVSTRLSGEDRHEPSNLNPKEVLSFDTCVWPLLAMEAMPPRHYRFDKSLVAHWKFIVRTTYDLLCDELPLQGSGQELRNWLKSAIFARICGLPHSAWEDKVNPLSFSLATLKQYTDGTHGVDADGLWSLMHSPDQGPGGYFGLLIDSLLEAGLQCHFKSRIQVLEIGGVEQANCTICLEQEESISLPCGHCFGRECLMQWFTQGEERNCPTCRIRFPPFLVKALFSLNYDNLCQMVAMNEELERKALLEIHDITNHGRRIIEHLHHSIWQMLESDAKYTMSIDQCLFPLITMSKYLETLVDMRGIDGKCWHILVAGMCYLLRTTFFGRQGTAAELCEELQIAISRLLQAVDGGTLVVEGIRESVMAVLRVAGDSDYRPCYGHDGDWTSLFDFLVLYTISKCPKHESRGRSDSDGE